MALPQKRLCETIALRRQQKVVNLALPLESAVLMS
jgi:hypothetical protein